MEAGANRALRLAHKEPRKKACIACEWIGHEQSRHGWLDHQMDGQPSAMQLLAPVARSRSPDGFPLQQEKSVSRFLK